MKQIHWCIHWKWYVKYIDVLTKKIIFEKNWCKLFLSLSIVRCMFLMQWCKRNITFFSSLFCNKCVIRVTWWMMSLLMSLSELWRWILCERFKFFLLVFFISSTFFLLIFCKLSRCCVDYDMRNKMHLNGFNKKRKIWPS